MHLRRLVPLAALAASTALGAEYQVIILGGGKAADAQAALKQYEESGLAAALRPAAGYPRVVESASIEGLKPGFTIAVLGLCGKDDPAAKQARDLANTKLRGVYLRAVQGEYEGLCPKLASASSAKPLVDFAKLDSDRAEVRKAETKRVCDEKERLGPEGARAVVDQMIARAMKQGLSFTSVEVLDCLASKREAIDGLAKGLQDADAATRGAAARALGGLRFTSAQSLAEEHAPEILSLAQKDPSEAVRIEASFAYADLLKNGAEKVVDGLGLAVSSKDYGTRESAWRRLEEAGRAAEPVLRAKLEGYDFERAAQLLAKAGVKTADVAEPVVRQMLKTSLVHDASVLCLHGPEAVAKGRALILAAFDSTDVMQKEKAFRQLEEPCLFDPGQQVTLDALAKAIGDASPRFRALALVSAMGLVMGYLQGDVGPQQHVLALVPLAAKALDDPDCRVRQNALEAIGQAFTPALPKKDRLAAFKPMRARVEALTGGEDDSICREATEAKAVIRRANDRQHEVEEIEGD